MSEGIQEAEKKLFTCKACGWSGFPNARPRCLQCARDRASAWQKANPLQCKARKKRYLKRFKIERRDEFNQRRRRLRKPEHNSRHYQERKAWLISGDVNKQQLITIYERDKTCRYCGGPVRPRFSPNDPRGFDHITPRAKGGKHTANNLTLCCTKCNSLKSDN